MEDERSRVSKDLRVRIPKTPSPTTIHPTRLIHYPNRSPPIFHFPRFQLPAASKIKKDVPPIFHVSRQKKKKKKRKKKKQKTNQVNHRESNHQSPERSIKTFSARNVCHGSILSQVGPGGENGATRERCANGREKREKRRKKHQSLTARNRSFAKRHKAAMRRARASARNHPLISFSFAQIHTPLAAGRNTTTAAERRPFPRKHACRRACFNGKCVCPNASTTSVPIQPPHTHTHTHTHIQRHTHGWYYPRALVFHRVSFQRYRQLPCFVLLQPVQSTGPPPPPLLARRV